MATRLNRIARMLISGVVVLFVLAYSNSHRLVASPGYLGQSTSESQELHKLLNRIYILGTARDLAGLEAAVEEHIADWEKMGMDVYGDLMLAVVQTLASEPFKDSRQYELARRYARLGLEKAGQISLEVELKLVRYIEIDLGDQRGEEWAQQRTADMKLWFQAWKRLSEAEDPNWDPNNLPQSKVSPPLAAGLPAGVVPGAIKDPKLRADYEAAIEANRKNIKRYNQQYRVRKMKKRFFAKTERYVIAAYTHPPFDLEGLQQNLTQYVVDKIIRKRINAAVRKNIGLGS